MFAPMISPKRCLDLIFRHFFFAWKIKNQKNRLKIHQKIFSSSLDSIALHKCMSVCLCVSVNVYKWFYSSFLDCDWCLYWNSVLFVLLQIWNTMILFVCHLFVCFLFFFSDVTVFCDSAHECSNFFNVSSLLFFLATR